MKVNSVNLNTNNTIREKKTVFYSVRNNKPDTFERTTIPKETPQTNPVNIREEYSNTIKTLSSMHDKAKDAFDSQIAADGWSGKLVDKLSALWFSKNRASLVKNDLIKFDNQVKALDTAAKKGNFRAKFKETFGVDFNRDLIDKYEQVSKKNTLVVISSELAAKTEEKLKPYISYFEENSKYLTPKSHNEKSQIKFAEADKKFDEFEMNISDFFGGKDNLYSNTVFQKEHYSELPKEDKAEILSQIAEQLIEGANSTAKEFRGGKKDEQLQKEYDEAFKKAFGSKNDIVKRVDKYVRSQQIGAVFIRDSILAGAIGATIATSGTAYPALVGSGVTFVGCAGLDMSEYLTNNVDNKEDMSKDVVKDIIKDAAISGVEYMVGSKLYDFIPVAKTASPLLNGTLNTARIMGIELPTAFVAEYARTGKWATEDMDPKSFIKLVFTAYAIEEYATTALTRH